MTREERERVEKHFDELHAKATGITLPDDIRQAMKAAYIAGADYAIDMFAPRWISVEDYATDELPPLLDEEVPYGESVQVLFVVELNGKQFINKGWFDFDTGVWHSLDLNRSYLKENVTHWMPTPQPPAKLSNLERTGKNWKVKKGGEQ